MIRRPPRSTLFPYTPLSGSDVAGLDAGRLCRTLVVDAGDQCAPCRLDVEAFGDLVGDLLDADEIAASLNIKPRSEEHTSELQSLAYLVCRLLLEKKKNKQSTFAEGLDSSDSFAGNYRSNGTCKKFEMSLVIQIYSESTERN